MPKKSWKLVQIFFRKQQMGLFLGDPNGNTFYWIFKIILFEDV